MPPPAKPVGQEDKKGIVVTGAMPLFDSFMHKPDILLFNLAMQLW
jgi:hypothetical protein